MLFLVQLGEYHGAADIKAVCGSLAAARAYVWDCERAAVRKELYHFDYWLIVEVEVGEQPRQVGGWSASGGLYLMTNYYRNMGKPS